MLLAGVVSLAQAQQQPQDEGPIVIGEQKPNWKSFQLVRLDAALDLWGQWRRDQLKQTGQPTLTETETTYRQTLDLSGEAYIGHKNLIDLSGAGKIGLEEEDLRSDETQSSNNYVAVTALGEVSALILGNSAIPTTAYAKRDEVNTHQDFGGTIKTTTTEFGAIAQLRSTIIPTQLQVLHREQDQEDQLGRGGFSFTQDSALLHSDARLTSNQHLLLDYTFDHVHESNTSGFRDTYNQHDATATHLLNFGGNNHDWLRSSLHLLDRDGTFSEQIVHLDEDMYLEHSPRLDTRYKLSLEDVTHQDQEQRQARGSAQIRHHLFESLTSTGTIGAGVLDVPDEFTSSDFFASGSLDYTKKVPLGRFDASASLAVNRQDNGARGSTVAISNRTFVFNDPFPVTISQRNIVPSSIVVRDTARLRVFILGADYTVASFPDRVELHRVVGGAIANGQAVSVDYDVGPEAANTIDSTTGSISLRYDITEGALSGLGVYAIYRRLDQSVDSAQPEVFVLEDFNEYRFGADYHIGGATFTAERTDHNSNVTPYDSMRLVAQYDRRFSRSNVLSLSLSWEDLEYRLTGQKVQLFLGTGRWSQRLGEDLDFSLHSEARQEYHNDAPDLHGVNAGIDLSWHKRQTTIYASVFGSILDSGSTTTTSGTVSIGLKRAF